MREANKAKLVDGSARSTSHLSVSGSYDPNSPGVKLTLTGDTYANSGKIKSEGYKWQPGDKTWSKTVPGKHVPYEVGQVGYGKGTTKMHMKIE